MKGGYYKFIQGFNLILLITEGRIQNCRTLYYKFAEGVNLILLVTEGRMQNPITNSSVRKI